MASKSYTLIENVLFVRAHYLLTTTEAIVMSVEHLPANLRQYKADSIMLKLIESGLDATPNRNI